MTTWKRTRLVWISASSLIAWGADAPAARAANAVSDWSAIAAQAAVVNAGRGGTAKVDIDYVHIAIYDAVNAIDGGYTPFAVTPLSPTAGASPVAATAAAYRVLRWLFPAQQGLLDATNGAYLAGTPAGPAKTLGIDLGTELLALLVGTHYTEAQSADVARVVVHVTDYQRVPAAELAKTEAEVSAVYSKSRSRDRVGAGIRRNGADRRPASCRHHRPRPRHDRPDEPGALRSGRGLEPSEKGLFVLFED